MQNIIKFIKIKNSTRKFKNGNITIYKYDKNRQLIESCDALTNTKKIYHVHNGTKEAHDLIDNKIARCRLIRTHMQEAGRIAEVVAVHVIPRPVAEVRELL